MRTYSKVDWTKVALEGREHTTGLCYKQISIYGFCQLINYYFYYLICVNGIPFLFIIIIIIIIIFVAVDSAHK
jgi:hypothetical protein